MPQLDLITFFSQTIWLFFFGFCYYVIVFYYFVLPSIYNINARFYLIREISFNSVVELVPAGKLKLSNNNIFEEFSFFSLKKFFFSSKQNSFEMSGSLFFFTDSQFFLAEGEVFVKNPTEDPVMYFFSHLD
jgi:hypothetical protein